VLARQLRFLLGLGRPYITGMIRINLPEIYQPKIRHLEVLQNVNPTGYRQDEINRIKRILNPNIYE